MESTGEAHRTRRPHRLAALALAACAGTVVVDKVNRSLESDGQQLRLENTALVVRLTTDVLNLTLAVVAKNCRQERFPEVRIFVPRQSIDNGNPIAIATSVISGRGDATECVGDVIYNVNDSLARTGCFVSAVLKTSPEGEDYFTIGAGCRYKLSSDPSSLESLPEKKLPI